MRIIMAVLDGGSNPEYNKMRDIWMNYTNTIKYTNHNTIELVFLRASPLVNECIYDASTQTLWTPGEETVMPGILNKTKEAIQYYMCQGHFDYFYRTNLSSLFDYDVMIKYLQENPMDYGGKLENAFDEWEFASGAGFVLSYHGCQVFLEHFSEMDAEHDLLDDVAIGKIMQKYVAMTYIPRITFSYTEDPDVLDILTNDYRDIFHYRCHSDDEHKKTIEYMEKIVKKIRKPL